MRLCRNLVELVGNWVCTARGWMGWLPLRSPSLRIHNRKRSRYFVTRLIHPEILMISRLSSLLRFGLKPNLRTKYLLLFLQQILALVQRTAAIPSIFSSDIPQIRNFLIRENSCTSCRANDHSKDIVKKLAE